MPKILTKQHLYDASIFAAAAPDAAEFEKRIAEMDRIIDQYEAALGGPGLDSNLWRTIKEKFIHHFG